MAEGASEVVCFDIVDGLILDSRDNVFENLTDEEQMEVNNVVTLLESVKDNSLDDFKTEGNNAAANHHKNVPKLS